MDLYSEIPISGSDIISDEECEQLENVVQTQMEDSGFGEEAADILCENAPELGKDIVEKVRNGLLTSIQADSESWGYIDPKRWNDFYNWLYDTKAIDYKIPENTGFTDDLLK